MTMGITARRRNLPYRRGGRYGSGEEGGEEKGDDLGEKIPPSQNSVAEERPDIETLKVFGKGTGKPFFSKRVPGKSK